MALLNLPYTFTVGQTIVASQHNSNFQSIFNDYNGNITDANIAANAQIEYTKLALNGTIKSTDLLSTTIIDATNLPVGTSVGDIVQLVSGTNPSLPAVSAALLTNIPNQQMTSILSYGTSNTTGTSIAQTDLKMAYGTTNIGSQSTQTITNLQFTSATTYSVLVTTESAPQQGIFTAFAVKNSGSQITIYTNDNHTDNVCWFCIGV